MSQLPSPAAPVTGGFACSVVNFDAGAETPMAGVLTAAGIALTAAFLTPLFFNLPTATLAATIIVAVLALVDLGAIRRTFVYSKSDFTAMAATILVARGGHRGRDRDRDRGLDPALPLADQPAAHGGRRPGAGHRALPQRSPSR